jgi:hypothetical protein
MMENGILPKKAKHYGNTKEQLQFWLLGLGTIYEGLIMVLSLGFLTVNTRAWMLFELFEED